MVDCQAQLFEWAAGQHPASGLVLFAMGLIYGLYGLRWIRFLNLLPAAGIGALVGLMVSGFVPLAGNLVAAGGAVFFGVVAIAWRRGGIVLTAAATFALIGGYLAFQFGFPEQIVLGTLGLLGLIGALLTALTPKPFALLATALQGAALMVVGFVGLSAQVFPSLASSFCHLAESYGCVVPILLTMVTVTAYSYQANQTRGDILTGAQGTPQT